MRIENIIRLFEYDVRFASAEQLAEYFLEIPAYFLKRRPEFLAALFVEAVYQLLQLPPAAV